MTRNRCLFLRGVSNKNVRTCPLLRSPMAISDGVGSRSGGVGERGVRESLLQGFEKEREEVYAARHLDACPMSVRKQISRAASPHNLCFRNALRGNRLSSLHTHPRCDLSDSATGTYRCNFLNTGSVQKHLANVYTLGEVRVQISC